MTQQTKRAPGRPKSTATKAETTPSVEVKKPPIIRKEKENSISVYICPEGGVVRIVSPTDIVLDPETNSPRQMRYCSNESSIWADEQSQFGVVTPIIFRDKKLLVGPEKSNLKRYLDMFSGNVKNGGNVLYEQVETLNKEVSMDEDFQIHDAVSAIRDRDIEDLLPIALYNGIDVDRSVSDIRYDLLQIAKKSPKALIDSFDNPVVKARASVYQANQYGIISLKENGAYWSDSNRLIVSNPTGQDCMETTTRFCLTEKGSTVLATLNDRLEALA